MAYVCSTPSLFAERVEVVVMLWNAGIKADFIKTKNQAVEKQKEYAMLQNSSYALIIEESYPYNSMIQVVNLAINQVCFFWLHYWIQ